MVVKQTRLGWAGSKAGCIKNLELLIGFGLIVSWKEEKIAALFVSWD